MPHLLTAARQFTPRGEIADLRAYGNGNVHDTYLVTPAVPGAAPFILQRLNTRVFPRPELLQANLRTVAAHVQRREAHCPAASGRRWETPRALLSREGADRFQDPGGSCWRALSFIGQAQSLDAIRDLAHAGEVGYALGRFHHLLSDLPPASLADTLPGFHVTPGYLRHYDAVLARRGAPASPAAACAQRFVHKRRAWAAVLEEARAQGRLRLRPLHGDPNVNNVMLDAATGEAIALVDLDTVKPGLVHYDIGDCLRSGCNPLGEETEQWEQVRFEPELCRAILQGYLPLARDFLTGPDYDLLYDAIRLLAFELGLRFFTDYLAGNVYFKVRHPDHNLARALVQFQLTASIEAQAAAIAALIQELR